MPIYNAYNHHYFSWLTGADSEVVDLEEAIFLPNPTKTAVRDKANKKSIYPSNIVFKENPGGEFRKSYHGYVQSTNLTSIDDIFCLRTAKSADPCTRTNLSVHTCTHVQNVSFAYALPSIHTPTRSHVHLHTKCTHIPILIR